MKKILLLISVLMVSSGCLKSPMDGFRYEIRNDTTWNGSSSIFFDVGYRLPEHRTKDFLDTLLIYWTKPELMDYTLFHITYETNNTLFNIYFGARAQITVSKNVNHNSNITDPMDDNYYTTIVTIADSLPVIEDTTQLHLRQDLESPTAINLMIKTKPLDATEYEYIGHTVLSEISVTEGMLDSARPLPDLLK